MSRSILRVQVIHYSLFTIHCFRKDGVILMGKVLGAAVYPHPPIIIEEIGRGEEVKAKNTIEGAKALSNYIKDKAPTTIILITPHGPLFSDAIAISIGKDLYGDFGNFGFKEISFEFENNQQLLKEIINKSLKEDIKIAAVDKNLARRYRIENKLDHGALVPLYFVDKVYKGFKLIHITYGLLSPKDLYKFGQCIKKAVLDSDEDVILIASGDLSHKLSSDGPYTYSPYGKVFDETIVNIIREGKMEDIITFDLSLAEQAGECGLRSFMVMAGVLDNYKLETEILSYEGPFGVGYCTAKLDVVGEASPSKNLLEVIEDKERRRIEEIRKNESPYVRLARQSLEHYINTGKYLDIPPHTPEELLNCRKGVFVSLKKDGVLRGCIGTIEPVRENIALEIIRNAVSAGTEDPRFEEVTKEELDSIVYSVDILHEPEKITSKDELDVEKYGIIVSAGYRRGLLLPNLEGIDTVDEQISIALKKANISPHEEYSMERFRVERYY